MTDIYIRQKRDSKGCLPLILGAFVLVIGVVWFGVFHRAAQRRQAVEEPEIEQTVVVQEVAEVAAPTLEPSVEAPTSASPTFSAAKILAEAQQAREAGELLAAREQCLAIIEQTQTRTKAVVAAEEMLSEISIELVMTQRPMPEKTEYTIQNGDTLGAMAKKFGTNIELIQKGNNVTGSIIHPGDRFRILNGTFSIEVDRSENTLVLFLNGRFFKRYPVGTGKFSKTPLGKSEITLRQAQPTWYRPDGKAVPFGNPENVLGTHWLSLDIRGYGIHGTWEPETIGYQESAGCIRLLNKDIEELYTLVTVGTPVVIKD